MKEVWIKVEPWNKELVTAGIEAGADAVVVAQEDVSRVRQLGRIKTVSAAGDLKWGEDVVAVEVSSAADEDKIVELSHRCKVLVRTTDWTIIPLENLVARASNVMVEVSTLEEARTAAGILERGVDGVVVATSEPARAREIVAALKNPRVEIELIPFTVERIRPLGMGDRVCIDTCSLMGGGEGALVGNSSSSLFLVHAESLENPYVSPRPFRVNAGPVHAYVLTPGGKTRYLSELKAGDEVLGVNATGQAVSLIVGRVKIERRPLLLVEANGPEGRASTICQNAETVRLVAPGGEALSVVALEPGDQVLGYVDKGGRHFGHKIEETITER